MKALRMSTAEYEALQRRVVASPARIKRSKDYAAVLFSQIIAEGVTGFHPEYSFDKLPGGAGREWRLDVAHLRLRLAVEVDGAVHRIKARQKGDLEKHQALFFAGWRLLRVSPREVECGAAMSMVRAALIMLGGRA